ncbi:MAG: hypothetical protein JRJ62_01965 [Deltaproteobacteria bacterium]|nr:hypothetical protein [Deltaproteobacteria bacterium]
MKSGTCPKCKSATMIMKSGTCPKCKSATVYKRDFPGGYRSSLVEDYICGTCGFAESYLADLKKVDKIKKHCVLITSQQNDGK